MLDAYKSLPALSQVRYRREHLYRSAVPTPGCDGGSDEGCCDGAALLAVVHFYCPEHMRLDGI